MRRFAAVLLLLVAACTSGTDTERTATPKSAGPIGTVRPGSVARFDDAVDSMRGKPLVVNFWGTWCDPCKAELPRLADAARRYDGRIRFLGVDVQDDSVAAQRFTRLYGIPYDSISDPQRKIVGAQKLLCCPVTQFYSASGKVAFVHFGELKAKDLDAKLTRLIRVSRAST